MEKKTNNISFGSYVKLIKGFSVANVFRGVEMKFQCATLERV